MERTARRIIEPEKKIIYFPKKVILEPFPFCLQKTGYCGAVSPKMVIEYYGKRVSQEGMAKLIGTTHEDGCNPEDIVRGAEKVGFPTEFQTDFSIPELEDLIRQDIPPIVGWHTPEGGDHYTVVIGFDKNLLYHADPQFGAMRKIYKPLFDRLWIGCYDLEPTKRKDYFDRGVIIIRRK